MLCSICGGSQILFFKLILGSSDHLRRLHGCNLILFNLCIDGQLNFRVSQLNAPFLFLLNILCSCLLGMNVQNFLAFQKWVLKASSSYVFGVPLFQIRVCVCVCEWETWVWIMGYCVLRRAEDELLCWSYECELQAFCIFQTWLRNTGYSVFNLWLRRMFLCFRNWSKGLFFLVFLDSRLKYGVLCFRY